MKTGEDGRCVGGQEAAGCSVNLAHYATEARGRQEVWNSEYTLDSGDILAKILQSYILYPLDPCK